MHMKISRGIKQCSDQCVAAAVVGLLLFILLSSGGFLLYKVYEASNEAAFTVEAEVSQKLTGDFSVNIPTSVFEKDSGFSDFQWVVYADHPNFLDLSASYDHSEGRRFTLPTNMNFINPFWMIPDHLSRTGEVVFKGRSLIGKFKIQVLEVEKFFALQSWLMIYMLFSMGIVFGTFIIDIALALILKEKYLVFYALFLSVAQLYMYTSSGLSRISIGLSGYWFLMFGFATLGAALLFIDKFLKMKTQTPKISAVNKGIAFVSGFGIFLVLFGFWQHLTLTILYQFILVMGLLVSLWALWALFYFKYKGHEISPYFLIGSIIQASTIPILVIAESGLVAENMVYDLCYMFAASINGIFFTLGIVQQLKDVRTKNALFYELATTDKLTGALNRYSFDTEVSSRIEMAERSAMALSLMILDIDYFKKVNDSYGHDVGDCVLRELVYLTKHVVRKSDKIYRWGGEEFAVLMENTSLETAAMLAEKLRAAVYDHSFETVGSISISVGVAQWRSEEKPKEWFKRMDKALYTAKKNGRNRVEISVNMKNS